MPCSRREIVTLQAENYSLERQLFSYQKSIAYAHSRGPSSGYEPTTPDGRVDDDDEHYPYSDRGLVNFIWLERKIRALSGNLADLYIPFAQVTQSPYGTQ